MGTYTWHASYSGDSLNNSAADNGQNESLTTVKASPTISTQASETAGGVVGTAMLSDMVTVSGGDNPGGSVTFTPTAPDGTTSAVGSAVTITGDGTYSASTTVLATEVGMYTWHASYSGDSLNNGASDNGQNESLTTVKASPTISTTAGGTVVLGSGSKLTDSATLDGGSSPTGTITFTLYAPDGTTVLDTETATVTADGTYNTPNGYMPTAAGAYQWVASYGGDANNNGVASSKGNEPETVSLASPTMTTMAGPTVVLGSGSKLTDSAALAGGYNPTGTITFTLYSPNGTTVVDTETATVTGDGTYSTPNGYLPTAAGTYEWVASYGGDANNVPVSTTEGNEPELVSPASPTISTTAGGTVVLGSGSKLTDSATLAGGYSPTGTITFTLYAPTEQRWWTPRRRRLQATARTTRRPVICRRRPGRTNGWPATTAMRTTMLLPARREASRRR